MTTTITGHPVSVANLDDLPLHVTRATDCDGDRWHRSPHNPARWALEGSDDWWMSSTASDEYGPFTPVEG